MFLDYYIIGGNIKIQKSVFIQEMLSKESLLRGLLNWKTTKDFSIKHPMVGEVDENNAVTVNFSSEAAVRVNESPKEMLSALKAKYKEKIKGRVACRIEYSAFGGIFTYEIDMNSDTEITDYITK